MKLTVDFSNLSRIVDKVTKDRIDFNIDEAGTDFEPIDVQLQDGLLVEWPDVESTGGLLSYQGRQILLYIQDHSFKIVKALDDGNEGNKFHVSHCRTLEHMVQSGRFDRYRVTQNLSGDFYIDGINKDTDQHLEGNTDLKICMNCLKKLNYKNSAASSSACRAVKSSFQIPEFFEAYSSLFKHFPKGMAGPAHQSGYSPDWKAISGQKKKQANYVCGKCGVNLSDHKRLLHVHHKNGVKSDNADPNLQVLCASCHKLEPNHSHMHLAHKDQLLITRLRNHQSIKANNWRQTIALADSALEGLLRHVEPVLGNRVPAIGVSPTGLTSHEEVFDIAWPDQQIGVYLKKAPSVSPGWTSYSLEQAMDNLEEFVDDIRCL